MQSNPRERSARRQTPPAATYSYAQVESALAKVFDAEDAQRGAFRGRLKHFRKLGIPAQNPGKGARLRYSTSDVFQLLVCLELSEFDVDPILIVKIVQDHWTGRKGFWAAVQIARDSTEDYFALLSVRFMSASLGQRRVMQSTTEWSVRSAPNPVEIIRFIHAHDLQKKMAELVDDRLCVFNLSARIRAVIAALKD